MSDNISAISLWDIPFDHPNSDDDFKISKEEKIDYVQQWNCFQCPSTDNYEKVAKIGQGTFGEVYKARSRVTNDFVALKRILITSKKDGFPITALREIKILKTLNHTNIVKLIEICRASPHKNHKFHSLIFLVFEFCEHDLAGLLSNMNVKLSLGEIKQILGQLLNGLFYIHCNNILHRDIKGANILITKNGVLKLADFGLAKAISKRDAAFTNLVVTLWYRAPEILLGSRSYGPPIDMWGVGCIMAELWTRSPIMQGSSEQQQLLLISQLCGTPCEEVWPGVEDLPHYGKITLPIKQKRKVKERLRPYVKDRYGCDLLDRFLTLDPAKRIDADTALSHDFFWSEPMPCDLSGMLSQHRFSMFEYNSLKMKHHAHGLSNNNNHIKDETIYKDRVF